MNTRGFALRAIVLVAAAVTVAACGGGGDSEPTSAPTSPTTTISAKTSPTTTIPGQTGPAATGVPGTSRPPGVPVPPPAPPVVVPPANNPPPVVPPPADPPPQLYGTIVIRTVTVSGVPVPGVAVRISLMQPCDPDSGSNAGIPEDANEVSRQEGITDHEGMATFTALLGCYYFGMTAPPGSNPVPEGLHSIFLKGAGVRVSGDLRFYDPEPGPDSDPCAVSTVARDLDELEEVPSGIASVRECDGKWAVIAWDSPGDTQRIVRNSADGWSTYVLFPHDICWAKAVVDGVPARLQPYFPSC